MNIRTVKIIWKINYKFNLRENTFIYIIISDFDLIETVEISLLHNNK